MDDEDLAAQWAQQLEEESANMGQEKQPEPENTKVAGFAPLKAAGVAPGMNNLDFLLDVSLNLSVNIGSTRMLIKDLLQLGQGSIIELNKIAGEPMDVLVNDRLIARGEVVVVNDKFGIRLTDIMSPTERVEQLK
ncbi:MAG: flagellar motor switch protein FliN [Nitrospirae bacterium]|nr:flagellar motor switch protein FliN [Nitrospirota bacterium]